MGPFGQHLRPQQYRIFSRELDGDPRVRLHLAVLHVYRVDARTRCPRVHHLGHPLETGTLKPMPL